MTRSEADTLIAKLREAADELEKAHLFLNTLRVPRRLGDVECTLTGRIGLLANRKEL